MSGHGNSPNQLETTAVGTLGWVGVVILLAIVAIVFLSVTGPAGGN